MTLSVGAAAPIVVPPRPEQLVEGHTVFTVIEPVPSPIHRAEFGAAVAVYVREKHELTVRQRFPGVLWFNDQYLVSPVDNASAGDSYREPCTGAILAVNAGDTDPRTYGVLAYDNSTYVESYRVTDPNNRAWDVDKWNFSGSFVWTVGIYGSGTSSATPDDGHSHCPAPTDSAQTRATGTHGYGYPCGGNGGPACRRPMPYNAVLFFYLADLRIAGHEKNHTRGSTNSTQDVSGCEDGGNPAFVHNWPCPAGDDHREGNSHPYNPRPTAFGNLERETHGYSSDCTGDGAEDRECHATRFVDIYYDEAPPPYERKYRFIDDSGRQTSPFHCHQAPNGVNDICT